MRRKEKGRIHFYVCKLLYSLNYIGFLWAYFRAPVLVALALMECGMKYEDAVELIRE